MFFASALSEFTRKTFEQKRFNRAARMTWRERNESDIDSFMTPTTNELRNGEQSTLILSPHRPLK